MRKTYFCLCKMINADQMCTNCTADYLYSLPMFLLPRVFNPLKVLALFILFQLHRKLMELICGFLKARMLALCVQPLFLNPVDNLYRS